MTSERIVLLVVGVLNVGAGALLGFGGDLPLWVKAALTVTVAVCGYVLAQMKSWGDTGTQSSSH